MSCLGLLHFAKSGIANGLRIILLFKASTIGRAVQILIMKHFLSCGLQLKEASDLKDL